MRKLQLLILAAAVVAGVIWWGFYRTHHTSSLGVASLVPKETLALVHLPDFNHSRDGWHRTDLYQLWKEPSVQEFLTKPRSSLPVAGGIGETANEISTLEMKDAFFAVVSIESDAWLWDGGFRCAGDTEKAAKLVEEWRARLLAGNADVKHETMVYQGRTIHNDSAGVLRVWTAWAGPWFFFANDLENLKALLDRADGRVKEPSTVLSSEENYLAALKHMPANYAALVFGRVAQFAEKVSPRRPESELTDKLALLREIRSFCAAVAFDGGRIHDTVFVGMPKAADLGNLTRGSLPIATKDTFFYAAGVLDLQKDLKAGGHTSTSSWLSPLQRITDSLSTNGVSTDEWKSAFGSEFGLVASWSSNSQWPTVVAAMPVKDVGKANQIVTTITTSTNDDDLQWRHREKDGAHYYASSSGLPLFSFSPTIGLSDRILVVGLDGGSVEAAVKHGTSGSSELAATRDFQNADRAVPTAQQAFVYLDPALFYTRFDATLRPLLAMGAAFWPTISETIDVSKLPPADVVAKHLSPTVMSQTYRTDGYVAESVGSVPLYQTVIGAMAASAISGVISEQPILQPTSLPPNVKPAPPTPRPSSSPDAIKSP